MGPFTLAEKTSFGERDDSVEVELDPKAVRFIHHGAVDRGRKQSGHSGSVSSWFFEIPLWAIHMIRTEDVPVPEAKPGILTSLLGMKVRTVPSLPTVSPEVFLVVEADMKEGKEVTVVLRGPRRELKQLEQQLTASRRGVRYRF